MSYEPCKYKKFDQPRFCQIIEGECQFITPPYDSGCICPIYHGYYDFDKWWMEEEMKKHGKVTVENIKVIDEEDDIDQTDILDITLPKD